MSFLEYGRHVGQLRRRRRRRRRRRVYAPTSNTASQDNHEKINSWVSFIFPLHDEYGAPLGAGAPLLNSSRNVLLNSFHFSRHTRALSRTKKLRPPCTA